MAKGGSLTVQMSKILGVIWGGMIGYQVFAKYLLHEELFWLAQLGLILGTLLTIAAMLWMIRLAQIVSASSANVGARGGNVGPIDVKALAPPDINIEEG